MTNRTHRTLCLARVLRLAALAPLAVPAVLGTAAKAQSYNYSTLTSFSGSNGSSPASSLTLDNTGNLYGTTAGGGPGGLGTAFKISAGTNAVTTLASFYGNNGFFPEAGLTFDSSGNLYGTTALGGINTTDNPVGCGTVFEITPSTNAFVDMPFDGTGNGTDPASDLTFDSSGNLYGTTYSGGSSNVGTVFEIAAGTNTITTLATFTGTGNGASPIAGLILDSSGNLYGTTSSGGSSGDGTVFKIAAGTNTITTLATFTGTADGASPYAALKIDSSGNLYGTTSSGGSSGDGTVFKIGAGTNTITTLATFTGTANGANPTSNLTIDGSGNLYGTTQMGGSNNSGTVFEIAAGTNTVNTIYSFTGTGNDGANPVASLTLDSNGNLYGSASAGGTSDVGLVFKLIDATPYIDAYTGNAFATAGAPVTGNFSNGFSALLVASSTNTTLAFGGTGYTVTNDLTTAVTVNALSFTNTGAVTIARGGTGTANQIVLDTNINGGATPTIELNNSGSVRILTDLALNTATTVTGAGTATIQGSVTGASGLTQSGTGTLILSGNNTNTGAWNVNSGTLRLSGGSDMMSVTVNSGGTLSLTNGVQFNNGGGFGTLRANSGGTVSIGNSTINGGYLSGAGTFTVNAFAGATLNNVTINATNGITQANATHLILNNGELRSSLTTGLGTVVWDGGLVTSAGSLNFGSGTTATLSNMEIDGKLNMVNGTTVNNTASSLVLGAGSQTNIGSKSATGGTLDLGGQTLELNGAFLSNNGTIQNGLVNINYGATAKGSGTYAGGYSVNYGGKIIFGNSPGTLTSGAATWNGGSSLGFQIDDATGTAGVGWANSVVNGALTLNASPSSKITLDLTSLLPTGGDTDFGALANFDPTKNYSWDYVTTAGGINGFDVSDFFLDTSGFTAYNATDGGTLSISESGNDLHVNFTASSSAAAPEPGALALLLGPGIMAITCAVRRRRAGR